MAQPSPREPSVQEGRGTQHSTMQRPFYLLQTLGTAPGVCRGHVWPPGAVQVKAEGAQTWPQPRHPSPAPGALTILILEKFTRPSSV